MFGSPISLHQSAREKYGERFILCLHSGSQSSETIDEPSFFFITGKTKCMSGCSSLSAIRHDIHSPQESCSDGFVQHTYLASAIAKGSFPQPAGPQIIMACGNLPACIDCVINLAASCWPITELNPPFLSVYMLFISLSIYGFCYFCYGIYCSYRIEMYAWNPVFHKFLALVNCPFTSQFCHFVICFTFPNLRS